MIHRLGPFQLALSLPNCPPESDTAYDLREGRLWVGLRMNPGCRNVRELRAPDAPLSHLQRAADVFADRTAVVWKSTRLTYAEYHARQSVGLGIGRNRYCARRCGGDTFAQHSGAGRAHFGVPACGAVLCTINTRLEAASVAYTPDHSGAKLVLVDTALIPLAEAALALMETEAPRLVGLLIMVLPPPDGTRPMVLLAAGNAFAPWVMPQDEWESIALNYIRHHRATQGVVYHHISAYLGTMANVIGWRMQLFGLPDDCAAVSLQRLVPHLDDADDGWHAGLLPRHHRRRRFTTRLPIEGITDSAARPSF